MEGPFFLRYSISNVSIFLTDVLHVGGRGYLPAGEPRAICQCLSVAAERHFTATETRRDARPFAEERLGGAERRGGGETVRQVLSGTIGEVFENVSISKP